MGDLLSNIYDTYEDYKILCKKFEIDRKDINSKEWLEEYYKLIKKENE